MHIVIVGNGIAGTTAARHIRKLSNHRVTLISSETPEFFARTALMYVYMGQMTPRDIIPYEPWFWPKNHIDLLSAHVTALDVDRHVISLADGRQLTYDRLIIASGSQSRTLQVPGAALKGVQGLYAWQDLQSMEDRSAGLEHAVITGGGLIGVEMAEMFRSRNISVTMLVRESGYFGNVLPPEEAQLVTREIERHGVTVLLDTELAEIHGSTHGHVTAVSTSNGLQIPCGFVGITIGVAPRTAPFDQVLDCDEGILVDDELRTSAPHVLAAGDCVRLRQPQPGRKATEPVWYTARIMGEVAAHNACGFHVPYTPGIWFNSAKFFDIEYQVYGDIRTTVPEDQRTLYWEDAEGRKSIRIHFNIADGTVVGFNVMGIRYRQEVCEKWIAQRAPIEHVLSELELANFDGEFSTTYEEQVRNVYARQYGTAIRGKASRNPDAVLRFLAMR